MKEDVSSLRSNPPAATRAFFDVGQAAMRWHTTEETIRRRVRRGEIRAVRPGRRILIPIEEIKRIENT